MWLGLGWRLKPWRLFELIAGAGIVTYVVGWLRGKQSAEQEKHEEKDN